MYKRILTCLDSACQQVLQVSALFFGFHLQEFYFIRVPNDLRSLIFPHLSLPGLHLWLPVCFRPCDCTTHCVGTPLASSVMHFMGIGGQAFTLYIALKHAQISNSQRTNILIKKYLHFIRIRKVGMCLQSEKVLLCQMLAFITHIYHFRHLLFCSFLSQLNLEFTPLNQISMWLNIECCSFQFKKNFPSFIHWC